MLRWGSTLLARLPDIRLQRVCFPACMMAAVVLFRMWCLDRTGRGTIYNSLKVKHGLDPFVGLFLNLFQCRGTYD